MKLLLTDNRNYICMYIYTLGKTKDLNIWAVHIKLKLDDSKWLIAYQKLLFITNKVRKIIERC